MVAGETAKYPPSYRHKYFRSKMSRYLLTDEVSQTPQGISPRASALARGPQMMDGDTQPFSWVNIGKKYDIFAIELSW